MFNGFSDKVAQFFQSHNVKPEDVYNVNDVDVLRLYSIYDRVADVYESPFPAKNDGIAKRMIEQMSSRSDNIRRHPEDYELVMVGYFSQATGLLLNEGNFMVCRFDEVLNSQLENNLNS